MSNPYLFLVRRGAIPRGWVGKIRAIARRYDCEFYRADGRAWFATKRPQLGHPFDSALRKDVLWDLERAGIDYYPETGK